jgi:hypothetical protein
MVRRAVRTARELAIYTPQTVTPLADTTAPTAARGYRSPARPYPETVTWGAASDNVTAAASLRYKLVRASASTSIDTIAKVNAITGADLIMDWSTNTLTDTVTGLTGSTTYWFAVLVEDGALNRTLYAPQSVTTRRPGTAARRSDRISFAARPLRTTVLGTATDNATASGLSQVVRASILKHRFGRRGGRVSGAGLVMDWTPTIQPASTGLPQAPYGSRDVRDEATTDLYAPHRTPPQTHPPIGHGYTASASRVLRDDQWGAPRNVTAASQLQ